ncbi:ABC transporter ATP-binding protein [Vulcanibacillus modesticaldus]|uniref:ABC transporter ATP-binding protein n=1 Tax=Vulcanibacillus modesticaldus TaxID=337097 RepID=A0A1D2YW40_9BACI|nr:ATP-binding cassette domain-containing protein [Vulcanibacillus modesticaldus]OEF99909.1 ABC transporter ATP-binding protein [Vulcanibacillus modesticaldus]
MLRVENVSKTFNVNTVNEKRALNNINLKLHQGDFVTVIGTNGAGKSTLMNAIAGVFNIDSGTILVDGKDVTKLKESQRAKYIGRVFQNPLAGTSPNMTIEENLAMAYKRGQKRGLRLALNNQKKEFFKSSLELLELNLESRLQQKVGLLSGGERQALSLLMATFTKPKVLLLDEHTAALDPKRAELINKLTKKIVQNEKLTTLMITHNMEHALKLGNRLIMMHQGEIILELDELQKKKMTIKELIDAFEKLRGEQFALDSAVLG